MRISIKNPSPIIKVFRIYEIETHYLMIISSDWTFLTQQKRVYPPRYTRFFLSFFYLFSLFFAASFFQL